jgi:hypothetical protein
MNSLAKLVPPILALLLMPTLLAQYPQVPVTGNIGAGGVFPLINSPSVVFATDADHLMVYPEMSGSSGVLAVTSSTALSTQRNLIVPTGKYNWIVENLTTGGKAIYVEESTGAGVQILNGYAQVVGCDATHCFTPPAGSGGTVLSVTATAPVASTAGTNPIISMAQATAIVNGWLSSADWATFNGKQAALGYTPAHSGANADITSLSGLTTPLSSTQGGSGTAGGTGYRYGNGASPDTYNVGLPGYITLGGALTSANVTFGTGAGVSPTLADILGNDASFELDFTTGSLPSANQTILTVTFTASRGHSSFGIVSPQYDQYSSVAQIPSSVGGSPTSIVLTSGTAALTASTSYHFNFFCP